MAKLRWDQVGERRYETGVDHGVLYVQDNGGNYPDGVAWNGLTTVTESPSGAESSKQYADNIEYLNLISAEQFGGTIEAFTYPDEFAECDGTLEAVPGLLLSQQRRRSFGFAYRTKVGNDVLASDLGYKVHVVYGAIASPSEKAHATVNDSPEAMTFSWEFSTTPVDVNTPVNGQTPRPTSHLTFDSTRVDADALRSLEDLLFGTDGVDARLPLPDEIIALFAGTVDVVTPTAPTFDAGSNTLTVPATAGVEYRNVATGEVLPTGAEVITEDTEVRAYPTAGNRFPDLVDDRWFFAHTGA